MKSFIKSIIITVLVSICGIASAQFERFEEAVESGNFKRLEKLCEDKAEDNELKRIPDFIIIQLKLMWSFLRMSFI